jgi:CheY-like chemotaxis protein
MVRGDAMRLRQVLNNLLGNAVKFTEKGSVTLRLDPGGGADGGASIRFSVVDSGIGIPPEAQARIFEPFAQADNSHSRRFGGTGLGLSISRDLVAPLGGTLSLESECGKGSTFAFAIPLPAVAAPAREPARSSNGQTPRPRVAGTVLVVEDNDVNREIVTAMLESLGLRFVAVDNGSAAVARAAVEPFDAVLMDCEMPDMDGFEATRRIRSQERDGDRVPIVALTAHAMQGDRERCLGAGMDDHLSKPFTRAELQATLDRWVEKHAPAAVNRETPGRSRHARLAQ